MRLSDIQPQHNVIISRIEAGRGLTSRLAAMGIIPGTTVTVINNDKNSPLIIMAKKTKIVLGRGMAHKITVQEQAL